MYTPQIRNESLFPNTFLSTLCTIKLFDWCEFYRLKTGIIHFVIILLSYSASLSDLCICKETLLEMFSKPCISRTIYCLHA